jgi:carboxyl-terminal processing protease
MPAPGSAPATATPPPDAREVALTATVLELLEKEHLLHPQINDKISEEAFKTYVDHLDGGKLFLLQADADALAAYKDQIDDELHSGVLTLAHEGQKHYAARVAVVAKLVDDILSKPFDFTNEEYLETDPKKEQLAANDAELRDRWAKRLELETLERVTGMEDRLAAQDKDKKKAPDPKDSKVPVKKDAKPVDNQKKVDPAKDTQPKPDAENDDDDDDRSSTPLKEIPKTPEEREAKARADIAKGYASRFVRLETSGPLDAASEVINAVAETIDPHTTYLPPADKANFDIAMSGTLEGIGAELREKEHLIEISSLVPGGAAWRQGGLEPGDLILSVQQQKGDPTDVFDMRIDDVVQMIRGKKGTIVKLRVKKSTGNEEVVTITRDTVVIAASYARGAILNRKGSGSYGYIHLPSFYGGKGANGRSASGDVHKLLVQMKAQKVNGVILDLRSNGGGLLVDAVELTGELIDKGPVVQVKGSHGDPQLLDDDVPGTDYDGPVIVMVDQFSASASEIVAGALQDYKRALIVGTSATHGKGTVQTLADLDQATGGKIELGVLKLTIQQFFRVSGASTQMKGVSPDILLPNPTGHIDSGERELPHALEFSQIAPAPHTDSPHSWHVEDLTKASATRVAKQPVLSKVAVTTTLLRERQKDTKIPLQRSAWIKRRDELKDAIKAVSPDVSKSMALLTVKAIDDGTPPPPPPASGSKKIVDPITKWSENLARDPWVDETVSILEDINHPTKSTASK